MKNNNQQEEKQKIEEALKKEIPLAIFSDQQPSSGFVITEKMKKLLKKLRK